MPQRALGSSASSSALPQSEVLRAGGRGGDERQSPRNPRTMAGPGPHTQSAAALPTLRTGQRSREKPTPRIPGYSQPRAAKTRSSSQSKSKGKSKHTSSEPPIQGLPRSSSLAKVMLSVDRMGAGLSRSESGLGSRQSLVAQQQRTKASSAASPVTASPRPSGSKALRSVAHYERERLAMWRESASPAQKRRGLLMGSGIDTVLQGVVDKVDPTGESVRLFLNNWLERYVQEEQLFDSKMVFCEMKLEELRHLTDHLPRPNPFRTWVCADLLMKLIDSFTDPHTRVVVSKVVEVVLASVYTDEESTVGLVPYALRARALYTELQDMRRLKQESLAKFAEVQARWMHVLKKWHPAIERAIVYWTRPLKTVVFLYWRRWAQLKRKRRGVAVVTKPLSWDSVPKKPTRSLSFHSEYGTSDEEVQEEDAGGGLQEQIDTEEQQQAKSKESADKTADTATETEDAAAALVALEPDRPAISFQDRLLAMRRRYDLRTIASQYFYEWKDVTLRGRTNKMKADRQQMVEHNTALQAQAEKVRVLKYALKDQLDRSQEQLEKEQEKFAALHKKVARLQRAEGDVAQERTYAERISKAFVWLFRVTSAGMIDGTRRLLSRGLQDPSLMKGFDDALRELNKDEATKERDVAERARLNLPPPTQPLDVWLDFQMRESGLLERVTQEESKGGSHARFTHLPDALGGMPDPFDPDGGLLSSLVRRSLSLNLQNPDPMAYQTHIDHLVQRMVEQGMEESQKSLIRSLQKEEEMRLRQEQRSASVADSMIADSDVDSQDEDDKPAGATSSQHPGRTEAKQEKTAASEDLNEYHELRARLDGHHEQLQARKSNGTVAALMSRIAARQAAENRQGDAVSWPDQSARTPDDFRRAIRQRDRQIDPFVLDAVQLLEEEAVELYKQTGQAAAGQQQPSSGANHNQRAASRPALTLPSSASRLDADMKEAVTLWLAIAHPGLPGDYDELLLLKEELKYLEAEYSKVLSGEREMQNADELNQMLHSVSAMKNALTATRKKAYEQDARWRSAVDEAERQVFHRLLARIDLAEEQPFSTLNQRTTQRFTRSQHIIRELIVKLDDVELQVQEPLANEPPQSRSKNGDPAEVLRMRKLTKKIKKVDLDREVLECELALGKHYTKLRELFLTHATSSQRIETQNELGAEEEQEDGIGALKFWLIVREHGLCNRRCKATAVERLFMQKIRARKTLVRELTGLSNATSVVDPEDDEQVGSLTFDDFIELLLRIAAMRMGRVTFPRRLLALLEENIFPQTAMKSPPDSKDSKYSGASSSISGITPGGLFAPSSGPAAASHSRRRSLTGRSITPQAAETEAQKAKALKDRRRLHFRQELKTVAFERSVEREEAYLRSLFRTYSKHVTPAKRGIAMSWKDFKHLVDDSKLIADGHISERAVCTTFDAVQLSDDEIPGVFKAADEKAARDASEEVYTGPGSGFSTANKAVSNGSGELIFIDFVEALTSLSCYCYKNPYLPLERKLRLFTVNVLQANQNIEAKRKRYLARQRNRRKQDGTMSTATSVASMASVNMSQRGATMESLREMEEKDEEAEESEADRNSNYSTPAETQSGHVAMSDYEDDEDNHSNEDSNEEQDE